MFCHERQLGNSHLSPPDQASASTSRAAVETPKAQVSTPAPEKTADQFEYYDAGNHWCKNCNVTCGAMFDFFTHLHSKSHRKVCLLAHHFSCLIFKAEMSLKCHSPQSLCFSIPAIWGLVLVLVVISVSDQESFCSLRQSQDPYDRPWATDTSSADKKDSGSEKITKPAKGTGNGDGSDQ